MRHAGGVLRRPAGGTTPWEIHTGVSTTYPDGTHYSCGLGALSVDAATGALVVQLEPPGVMTGFGTVIVDETFNDLGISCGVSASKDELRITFNQLINGVQTHKGANNPVLVSTHGNIWIDWNQYDG